MTPDEIMALTAGPMLDLLVHHEVMGKRPSRMPAPAWTGREFVTLSSPSLPYSDRSGRAWWAVVEHLSAKGWRVDLCHGNSILSVQVLDLARDGSPALWIIGAAGGAGADAPLLVCRAALLAVNAADHLACHGIACDIPDDHHPVEARR